VGRGNVGGLAILPPAIAKDLFAELGRRASNGRKNYVGKNEN
jgi:hypothetical protein